MTTRSTSRRTKRRLPMLALLAAFALVLAACGDDSDDGAAPADTSATTAAVDEDTTTTSETADEDMTSTTESMDEDMMGASGPACSSVPADGEGSFAGMADDPAATAASNNPLLSTLVTAVTEADLVDTLNSDGPFTIFAPTNDAFAAIPADQLDAVLADQELLTSVLTYHVIAGEQMSAADLAAAGTVTTVNGSDLTVAAEGDLITVNGSATTLCQDVPTANATVHIIDGVLMPG